MVGDGRHPTRGEDPAGKGQLLVELGLRRREFTLLSTGGGVRTVGTGVREGGVIRAERRSGEGTAPATAAALVMVMVMVVGLGIVHRES